MVRDIDSEAGQKEREDLTVADRAGARSVLGRRSGPADLLDWLLFCAFTLSVALAAWMYRELAMRGGSRDWGSLWFAAGSVLLLSGCVAYAMRLRLPKRSKTAHAVFVGLLVFTLPELAIAGLVWLMNSLS
ncbi:MAG: hypothetical protein ABSC51_07075 [Gaiellaceae bacterium]|jgi:hypothetical protein